MIVGGVGFALIGLGVLSAFNTWQKYRAYSGSIGGIDLAHLVQIDMLMIGLGVAIVVLATR